MSKVEKHIDTETGLVSLLYHPTFGCGWSSMHLNDRFLSNTLMFDANLIKIFLERDPLNISASFSLVLDYLISINIEVDKTYISESTWEGLRIKQVSPNSLIRISEYDGCESLTITENHDFFIA